MPLHSLFHACFHLHLNIVMQTITTAYSKFILSGEHFVVEGAPSVVIPASCFSTQVSLCDQETPEITAICNFNCGQPGLDELRDTHEALVKDLILKSAQILSIDLRGIGLRCMVKSSIPPGQGAGSSSSLSQAIMEAMMRHFLADDLHPNYLRWFSTQLENKWHGTVSGIDNAAIAYKRILFYERDKTTKFIPLGCPIFFVVGTTGPRDEIDPYAVMRALKQEQPLQYIAHHKAMSDNAVQLAEALQHGDMLRAGALMNESEDIYESCGIVTKAMQTACQEALRQGACGARMTGAGGGGFVIACTPISRIEDVQMAWFDMGLRAVSILNFGLDRIR